MYQIISYIKFLIRSKNHHSVHSPFVYSFVTKCLYDRSQHSDYSNLLKYRKQLLSSKEIIEIKDLGSGSKILKSTRHIHQMVKMSSSSIKKIKLLYRISCYFKFTQTLELGTHLGLGTQALALGDPNGKVTSIEGCPNIFQYTKQHITASNITLINNEFSDAIPNLNLPKLDCVFFDGNHTKVATLDYFDQLISKAHNDSVFIFDDIYWSGEMTKAWNTICNDTRVSVSIDIFHFGLVFFRKEQAKQHFVIRV